MVRMEEVNSKPHHGPNPEAGVTDERDDHLRKSSSGWLNID